MPYIPSALERDGEGWPDDKEWDEMSEQLSDQDAFMAAHEQQHPAYAASQSTHPVQPETSEHLPSSTPSRAAAVAPRPTQGSKERFAFFSATTARRDHSSVPDAQAVPSKRLASELAVRRHYRSSPPPAAEPLQPPPITSIASPAPASTPTPATSTTQADPAEPPKKKRGRPVGWRRGMGPYSAQAEWASSAASAAATPKPKLKPKPKPKAKAAAAAAAAASAAEGLPKRRPGRPARQQQPQSPPPRSIYDSLRPRFVPFVCEWEGCPAELRNLATLRRHLLVVHGRSDTCRWKGCGVFVGPAAAEKGEGSKLLGSRKDEDEDEEDEESSGLEGWRDEIGQGKGRGSIKSRTTREERKEKKPQQHQDQQHRRHRRQAPSTTTPLARHLEQAHLIPCAWHQGDGPQDHSMPVCDGENGENDADGAAATTTTGPPPTWRGDALPPPPYLFDARTGAQVTPSVLGQPVEPHAEWRERRRRLRRLIAQRDRNAPEEYEYGSSGGSSNGGGDGRGGGEEDDEIGGGEES